MIHKVTHYSPLKSNNRCLESTNRYDEIENRFDAITNLYDGIIIYHHCPTKLQAQLATMELEK